MRKYLCAEDYEEAFLQIRPLSKNQLAMLKAHCKAPKQTMTFSALAAAAGYESVNAVNLQYGLLAKRICDALSVQESHRPSPLIEVVATYEHAQGVMSHWELRMKDEVAAALKNLAWV